MKKTKTTIADAPEQLVPFSKITPADYNPRIDLGPEDRTTKDIERSLKTFGSVGGMVWNKRTGNLVAGHQRLKVLKAMGLKQLRMKVVDVSPEKERVLNVALNHISGDWDRAKMDAVLGKIEIDPADLELAGFTEEERALFESPIDDGPPTSFRTVGMDEKTDHACPKCGYEWSGACAPGATPPAAPEGK